MQIWQVIKKKEGNRQIRLFEYLKIYNLNLSYERYQGEIGRNFQSL